MKVVAFEDWMVSKEHPEGVSTVIMGREWTSRTAASSSTSGSGYSGMSSQLLQDHPELLVTEVDLEEDRDREDYNSVIKAQKAKDEASNADSGIGATTSNTTSATSKDRSSAVVAVKESSNLAAVSTDTHTLAPALAPGAEGNANFSMSGTTNDTLSIKLLSPNKQRQINEEAKIGERGERGGSNENSLKITLSLPSKADNSLLLSGETIEKSFLGNVLSSSLQSTTLHVEEEVESSGDMSMDIVHDSSVLVSALSLSSAPLSGTKLDESGSAVSTVRDVQDGMVDDAEALRKAFEDASDSDDDDDENEVNNANVTSKDTESGITGEAGGNNNDNDNNDDEDGSDDDGDEEELVIEEGGGGGGGGNGGEIKNEETPSNEYREKVVEIEGERRTSATGDEKPVIDSSNAAQGEDEGGGGGEEEANEDDDDDDEEDWMNDV